jgi:hypothetical protein
LWIERADLQLYRAKSEGRNQVCLDQPRELSVSAEEKGLLFGHFAMGEDEATTIKNISGDAPHDALDNATSRVNA